MSDNRIEDKSGDRSYFIITPQLVWALCGDPYELVLWTVVKMVAGEDGECYLSTKQLAHLAMMSTGKVTQCRQSLLEKGLLEGEVRQDPGYPLAVYHLRVPDLWKRNVEWRERHHLLSERIELKRGQRQRSPHERPRGRSPHERPPSPGERPPSPGETKKNQEEESTKELWSITLAELALSMPRVTYDAHLAQSHLANLEDGRAVVELPTQAAVEVCTHRLADVIERTLAGVVGHEVAVEFEAVKK